MLKKLQEMVDDLSSTNSKNEKLERLKKYDDEFTLALIKYAHDPMIQFNVTSKTIKAYTGSHKNRVMVEDDIFSLLDQLKDRKLTGHAALAAVREYVDSFKQYEDLIYSIIDKNLKIRMSDSSINKVFPDLIPEFKVQLADKYNKDRLPPFKTEKWYSSRKLDGVRCIAVVDFTFGKEVVDFYSRTGKEFFTLGVVGVAIKKELKKIYTNEKFILDGEMCIVDEKGDESFSEVIKLVRKKDYYIENPRYKIFDIILFDDFIKKSGKTLFSKRYDKYMQIKSPSGILDPVKQTVIEDEEDFNICNVEAITNEWEGLIIRKDCEYAGKRSKNMLKVKQFHEAEYVVKSIGTDMVRYIDETTGVEAEEEMLKRINIIHKGNNVGVGSGFSLQQRKDFFKDPSLIIGKTITVKFFEESMDAKSGMYSLRFPVLKAIHGKERVV